MWRYWCCTAVRSVAADALVGLKMQEAVLQQAGHGAEVADRTQTLQLFSHVALFPTTVTSTHLDRGGEED